MVAKVTDFLLLLFVLFVSSVAKGTKHTNNNKQLQTTIDNNCLVLSEFMRSMLVLHQEASSDSLESVIKDPMAKLATGLKK